MAGQTDFPVAVANCNTLAGTSPVVFATDQDTNLVKYVAQFTHAVISVLHTVALAPTSNLGVGATVTWTWRTSGITGVVAWVLNARNLTS